MLDKDLSLDILESHFGHINWNITLGGIDGEYISEFNEKDGYIIELIFLENRIKISKMYSTDYYENGQLAGVKINIITDICTTYDGLFKAIKEIV